VTLRLASGSTNARSRQVAGINYPWTIFEGRPNYGCDFGRNQWDSHAGVIAHIDEVRDDFRAMAEGGIEVVRWFVFTDGRGGVEWNSDGELLGIAKQFDEDMRAALDIAAATNVRLCLVLVDFAWLDHADRRRALESPAFIERVLDPVLARFGRDPSIHSFDIINEPDWVTRELATDPKRAVWSLDQLRTFVSGVSTRISATSNAYITLGGGRVKFAKEWDDPIYGLDFVQVHSYPDVRYQDRDVLLFEKTAADFGLTKPLLIGEFPSDPRQHPAEHLSPAYTLEDYVKLARDGGYLGAWAWSFNGVDAFGSPAPALQRRLEGRASDPRRPTESGNS
jgi:hypothetical protein